MSACLSTDTLLPLPKVYFDYKKTFKTHAHKYKPEERRDIIIIINVVY